MPHPASFCVTLRPRNGNGSFYCEVSTTAWTLACGMAQEQHPDCIVESVYQNHTTIAGQCSSCGQWQESFAVISRRVCRDCR